MKNIIQMKQKIKQSKNLLTEKVSLRYMLKPEYQEVLYILGLNPKKKNSQKQTRLTSEIIVNLLQNVKGNKKLFKF